MNQWHKFNVADVALEFGTDVKNGKTNIKHDKKRRGDNIVFLLPTVDSKATIKRLTSDASVSLLVVAYILTAFLGNYLESIIGFIFLIAVFCISFSVKNTSSKRIANSYRLLLPSAKIVEHGKRIRLSAFDVEVGDLVEFSQGDIIPADARIVFADNLSVAERYLDPNTGKVSYRREDKIAEILPTIDDNSETYSNIVYAASVVVSGKGRAIVTETGMDTKLSRSKSKMRIVSDNDTPGYFSRFFASAKRTSLFAFFAVIPLTLFSLINNSNTSPDDNSIDLLYAFLLLLSVAVTCMSELVIAPAETLVTKELLISSRNNKVKNNVDSRITKLSSAEAIADTDTLLILSSSVLMDTEYRVRRVYFADKLYRFDALKSEDLSDFYNLITPIIDYSKAENLSKEMISIKSIIGDNSFRNIDDNSNSRRPNFLRNFPAKGARACVFESDNNNVPTNCIFYINDPSLIDKCTATRTEGGGTWKADPETIKRIYSEYYDFEKVGLSPVVFISLQQNALIFEGIVGVGGEFPFADRALAEELTVSGIQPIVIIDEENQSNLISLHECGLINDNTEIALASEYLRNGMDITDSPVSTKAYVGFEHNDVCKLTDRLLRNGKKVLPVIKDSVDRRKIAPISVYAVHSIDSYDSVKISASMSIQPADANQRNGGVFDILKMIRGSSMARLKLGVYKNYLAFSMFLRVVAVCCSLLIGKSGSNITSLSVLTMGFVCDAVAVISLLMSKGIPVKPKEAAADAKVLFSSTLFLFFLIAGILSGLAIFASTEILISLDKLQALDSSMFLSYSVMFSQIVSLGGFLVILNRRCRRRALNWVYLLLFTVFAALIILQNYLPHSFFELVYDLKIYRMNIDLMPYLLINASISLAAVLLISKLLSSFSDSNIK